MERPAASIDPERRRFARQVMLMAGLGLTFLGAAVLLAAPDLTTAFVKDLPVLAIALVTLYAGGILLGVGYGRKGRARAE